MLGLGSCSGTLTAGQGGGCLFVPYSTLVPSPFVVEEAGSGEQCGENAKTMHRILLMLNQGEKNPQVPC